MSLFEELIEDNLEDEKIINSFQSKDTLCPSIFEKNNESYKMKNEIRKKLLEITDNFVESLGVDFFIHYIVLTGSLANFNWSEYSDVDLHILIDFNEIGDIKNKESIILRNIMKEFFY
jgi:hypothetical protein